MAIPETAGERIKVLLRERGLTQQQLADAIPLSVGKLNARIRSGRFTEDIILRIASALETTPAYLRYGITGTFEEGVQWAIGRTRAALDQLLGEAGARRVAYEARSDARAIERGAGGPRQKRKGA